MLKTKTIAIILAILSVAALSKDGIALIIKNEAEKFDAIYSEAHDEVMGYSGNLGNYSSEITGGLFESIDTIQKESGIDFSEISDSIQKILGFFEDKASELNTTEIDFGNILD